jgi:hypothetical protein
MDKNIQTHGGQCKTFAINRPVQKNNFVLLASVVSERPFQKLFIDYVGLLSPSKAGNTIIWSVLRLSQSLLG